MRKPAIQTLTLIRGLPGSGKSTLARAICTANSYSTGPYRLVVHMETDMYFNRSGVYQFDANKLAIAHRWCLDEVNYLLSVGDSVIVANTFSTAREMKPYIDSATKYQLPLQIIECKGGFNSIHGVPADAIQRMRDRWETIDL